MSERTSRWDSLRREGDSRPSSSLSSSSARPRSKLPDKSRSNTSYGSHNRSQENGKQIGARSHPGQSVGDNWRRRAANDAGNILPVTTAEEEAVMEAMKNVESAITSFQEMKQDGSSSEETPCCFRHSIRQLAASLFDAAGPTNFLENTCLHKLNSTKPLPNISHAVMWEAGYSLLRHIQLLSQPRESKDKCIQFILSTSSVALLCLQSLIHNQQQLQKEQFTRTKAMTDLRLCECASILLDVLGCERCPLFNGDATNTDEMMCKATLFSCLAKILTLSTMNARASPTNSKNSRERRGPLFPWGAEKSVYLIVKQTTLPFLELLARENQDGISVSTKVNYSYGAMECLYFLLKDPNSETCFENINHAAQISKHAAAILAPLVVDVLPDGKENQRVNPLRSRTLSAVSSFWEWSYELIDNGKQSSVNIADQRMKVLMSCQCMAAALNALSALRKNKAQKKQNDAYEIEIDVSTVARQLQSMTQNEEIQSCRPTFLNLLSLLCLAYPSASASQWHLFLDQSTVKKSPLLCMLEEGTSALASERFEDECWIALPSALRATSTLLTAMPFSLWISGDARPTMRMSGGNFSSRVRNALLDVMIHTFNLMTAIKGAISCESISSRAPSLEIVVMHVSEVARRLCTMLPFNGDNFILLQPASRLVQCAGDIYVHSAKIIVSRSSMSKLELEHSLLQKVMWNFGHVITESLGDAASNTIKVKNCSAPAEKWLSNASSYDFVGLLLTDSSWTNPSSKDRIEMLSAVAKRSPLTLTREPFNLASFCEVCAVQCESQSDVDSRILGLKLIESFLLGRKAFQAEFISNNTVSSVVPETFCPLLLVALEDHSAAVRTCAVSSFGSLLRHDWMGLFLSGACSVEASPIDWTSLESIIRLCSANEEKIGSVRTSCCKAIGDISSVCIGGMLSGEGDDTNANVTFLDDFVLSFTCKISEVMANALTDDIASVRSMALFAIGNTALALKERYRERFAPPSFPSMKQLFPSVCDCLGDKDEKVVANAIRSISHTAYFVYHPEIGESASRAIDEGRALLSRLSSKINFALDDAVGKSPSGLTWKKRNGAKKHAWGSCTTLGALLGFSNLFPYLDVSLMESALSSLFRCIQLSGAVNEKITSAANEKIIAAAISALAGLPMELWEHLSCKCDSIGRGLATCVGFLSEKKPTTSNHHNVESLVNVLLVSAKETDFCNLFLIQESIPFSVEYFYQWLVTHDVEAGVFDEITAAASSHKVAHILDVSVVQMFLSRTVQQHRRQGSPCKVNDASVSLVDDDEEGDEI